MSIARFDTADVDFSVISWTRNAAERLNQNDVLMALLRHFRGEWGHMSPEDSRANDESLRNGMPVMSCYNDRHSEVFLILTDQGHTTTTVLLPFEY